MDDGSIGKARDVAWFVAGFYVWKFREHVSK
jgi:hypothetical protein